jgi:hypothetical protein
MGPLHQQQVPTFCVIASVKEAGTGRLPVPALLLIVPRVLMGTNHSLTHPQL